MADESESTGEIVNHALLGVVDGALLLLTLLQLFLTLRIDRIDARFKEDERRGLFVDPTVRRLYSPVSSVHRRFHFLGSLTCVLLCIRVVDPLAIRYYNLHVIDGLSFNTTASIMVACSVMLDGTLRVMTSLRDKQYPPSISTAFTVTDVLTFVGCNVCVGVRTALPVESNYWGYVAYLYYLCLIQTVLIVIWHVASRRVHKAIVSVQKSASFRSSKSPTQRSHDSGAPVFAGGAAIAGAEPRTHSDDMLPQPTPEYSDHRSVDGALHVPAPMPFRTDSSSVFLPTNEVSVANEGRLSVVDPAPEARPSALRVNVPEAIPLSSSLSPTAAFQRIDIGESFRPQSPTSTAPKEAKSPRTEKVHSKDSDIDAALKKLRRFSIMFHALYVLASSAEVVIASTTVGNSGERLSTVRGKLPDDSVFMYLQTLAAFILLLYSWHPRTWYMLRSAAPLSSSAMSDPSLRKQPSRYTSPRRQISSPLT